VGETGRGAGRVRGSGPGQGGFDEGRIGSTVGGKNKKRHQGEARNKFQHEHGGWSKVLRETEEPYEQEVGGGGKA